MEGNEIGLLIFMVIILSVLFGLFNEQSEDFEDIFDETLTFEQRKMKEFFVAGIFKGKQNIDFDLDEEFKKFYSKLFPEE